MENLAASLAAVVEGDIGCLSAVLSASHPDLRAAAAKLPGLMVSRFALIRVLKEWRNGHCTADEVQRWASFVRRGYVSGRSRGPIAPIDIDYDADDEELIAEVIRKFDELGDLIDGCVEEGEQVEMLRALQQ